MRGIFSPHVIKKIMTGGISLSHITFLCYQDASRCYAMRRVVINVAIRSTLRRVATSMSRQKRRFPPDFPIVLSRCPNITTRRESNQSNHDVAIMSRLRCDYVMMCHNEISTSRCVATCVVIRKKLKKPNLIIINRVFSRF